MGSFFIYDSINQYRSDNTVSEGIHSGAGLGGDPFVFSVTSDAVADHERVSDQNIGTVITNVAANDAIAYQVGSAVTADTVAVYFTGDDGVTADGNEMTVYAGTAINALTRPSSGHSFGSNNGGWAVGNFAEQSNKTKFVLEFNEALTNVSEVLFGKKLSFEVEPDINVRTAKDYGTEIQKSMGGVEYAINVHDGQQVHTISFQNISSTFKDSLITMQDALKGQGKKFLYYDSSSYHWVRLDKTMQFTEVADGRFSTQIIMRQQIQ